MPKLAKFNIPDNNIINDNIIFSVESFDFFILITPF
jgi:hypothetical protein